MASSLTSATVALLKTPILRYARLVEITRADGVVLRYTDHDRPLEYEGETFVTALFDASAVEASSGFSNDNLELEGALSDEAIKEEDIRAGLYRGADVRIIIVDWLYPFAGPFRVEKYQIETTRWTGEVFAATLIGATERLNRRAGNAIKRDCNAILGDSRCSVDIEAHRKTGAITAINDAFRDFETDLTDADDLYALGEMVFTSGANKDVVRDVKKYKQASGQLTTQIRFVNAASVGDTFTVIPGCRKVLEDCKGTSGSGGKPWPDNRENFRGFPDLPGTQILIKSPNQ
mgnify:CR=1 FL=1